MPWRPRSAGGSNTPSLGRAHYQKGLQTLVWRADDENEDELVYDVLYRREGETTLENASPRNVRDDSRLGHHDGSERHLLRQDRRFRQPVEPG